MQYETEAFSQFALCILQKHNCLRNHAAIPTLPDPSPLAAFRGQPMTHELAEEISFGHLGTKPWSWKVIAGQNPAYDFFPSQVRACLCVPVCGVGLLVVVVLDFDST